MGKIKYFIFALLLGLMIIPTTTFAKESIEIKSIELDSKSENTVIKSEPTYSGLEMNFDLAFKSIGDNVKYKVVVKNDTDTDYKISEDTSFNESEYMTYKYEAGNELKAKGETTVYITITYAKEVDSSKLVNNKYIESNKAIVQLLDSEGQIINVPDTIKNPNTGDNLAIIVLILLLCISVTVLLLNHKKSIKYMSLVLALGVCAIPALAYATETIKLTINVSVEVSESYPVNYIIYETIKTSEESNYKIFDFSEYNVEEPSCRTIEGKDGYEVCAIIYKSENHIPGEKVDMISEFNYHSFNGNGDLVENTVPTNNTMQSGIWDYWFDSSNVAHSEQYDVYYWWTYNKDLNNYDDINEINFTGNIDNQWSDSSWPMIYLYSPNSFTMPSHGVFFSVQRWRAN